MQRQLSSFDIYVIVSELQELLGSYIDNIYQLSRDELLIRVKNINTKQKENIFVRNGELMCLTKKQFETPTKPTTFAMTLRKYLLNGRITEITQHEFDRIIKLKISRKEGDYVLIIEFFSDGNIILVNPYGEIIFPLISQRWAHRTIKTHESYSPPPSQINPFILTLEDFMDLLKKSKTDLVRTLAVNVNLGGFYAEEICERAGIEKNIKIKVLDEKNIKRVFFALSGFLELFKNRDFQPVLVKKDGKAVDILPFEFRSYEKVDFEETVTFIRGLQNFISVKQPEKPELSKSKKEIEKLHRQLKQQEEAVSDLGEKIQRKKFEGDLIYFNFQKCEELIEEISRVLQFKDKEDKIREINQKDMVKEFDPLSNRLVVYLQDTGGRVFDVKLDFRKTVAENAEKAYDDNKRLKNKLMGAKKSIEETKKLIESVKEQVVVEEKRETKALSSKVFWFERFRWFISSEGNVVVGGRDAKSNELVVKKYLDSGDRYAHADVHGAPSCVIKSRDWNDNKILISEKALEEVCIFAAIYSRAWNQFAEATAYWVLPEQVSKTPGSGEFLQKGAFVIRGKRNYYRCKLELGIGEIVIDDVKKIMGGPLDAIRRRSSKYVVLTPGDMKKSVIAGKLANVFDVPVDHIMRVLPPGNVTVIETVGLKLK